VTGGCLVHTRSATLTECDLNSGITVRFRRFDLSHTVVGHVQHGNGDRAPVIREDAHHANLATNQALALILVHFFSIPACDWAGLMLCYLTTGSAKNKAGLKLSRQL
jgi:hypothetical protein